MPDARSAVGVSGRNGEEVCVVDPAEGALLLELPGHDGGGSAVGRVSLPDGRDALVTGDEAGTIRLWDLESGEVIGEPIDARSGIVWSLCQVSSRTGRTLLVSGGDDGTIRVWDPATHEAVGEPLTGHTDSVIHMCRLDAPNGRTLLVTADDARGVRLWDIDERTTVGKLDLPGPVEGLCALPDGRLVIASTDWVCTARSR